MAPVDGHYLKKLVSHMDKYDLDYQAYLLGEEYVSMATLRWFTSDEQSGTYGNADIHLKVGRPLLSILMMI